MGKRGTGSGSTTTPKIIPPRVCVAVLVPFLIFCDSALSALIRWSASSGGNGHYYEVVDGYTTSADAQTAASSRRVADVQGYLATVTSAAENQFLVNSFGTSALRLHLLGG